MCPETPLWILLFACLGEMSTLYLHCQLYVTFNSCLLHLPSILLIVDSKEHISIQAAVATFTSPSQLLLHLESFPRAQHYIISTQKVWCSVVPSKHGMLLHISEQYHSTRKDAIFVYMSLNFSA